MAETSKIYAPAISIQRHHFIHRLGLQLKGDKLGGACVKKADVQTDLVDVPGRGGLHHWRVDRAGGVGGRGHHHLPLSEDQVRAGRGGVDVTWRGGGLHHGLEVVRGGVAVVGREQDGGRGAEVGRGRVGRALVHRGCATVREILAWLLVVGALEDTAGA